MCVRNNIISDTSAQNFYPPLTLFPKNLSDSIKMVLIKRVTTMSYSYVVRLTYVVVCIGLKVQGRGYQSK